MLKIMIGGKVAKADEPKLNELAAACGVESNNRVELDITRKNNRMKGQKNIMNLKLLSWISNCKL